MIWFTSDSHFGHKNIIRSCSNWHDKEKTRDFPTVEDHDNFLIDQLNKHVAPSDVLYHLGDFGLGFAWKDRFKEVRSRIKCETIFLCLGNHDHIFTSKNKKADEVRCLFKDVRDIYYKKLMGRAFVLCHYAMRTWPWMQTQSIMLYGHSHGNLADDPNTLSMDVGVDTCLFGHPKYAPYSAEEIFAIMDNFKKFVPVDHHKVEEDSFVLPTGAEIEVFHDPNPNKACMIAGPTLVTGEAVLDNRRFQ